ncbi:MAG: DUF5677 domain-containing protein [Pseudomonadota bacterium]
MPDFKGVIFTPEDEPYLGMAEIKALDDLIVKIMRELERAKPHTGSDQLSAHQKAAILLIPSAVSLCLSVRELIRQAYLHGALTLLRPILERTITIQYLRLHPNALVIWEKGWEYRKRPKLYQMTESLFAGHLDDELRELLSESNLSIHQILTKEGNDMVHGGLDGLLKNVTLGENGPVSSPGKVLNRPDLAKKAALECTAWLTMLMVESSVAFPES